MKNKYLYGKVVFVNNTTLLILMNGTGLLTYKLFNSLNKCPMNLENLSLTSPLPDHRLEVVNSKNESLIISKAEKADYFRRILETSTYKVMENFVLIDKRYYEILSIEII